MTNKSELEGNILFDEDLNKFDRDYVQTYIGIYENYMHAKNCGANKSILKAKKNKCISFAKIFFPLMTMQQILQCVLKDPWFIESILPEIILEKHVEDHIKIVIELKKEYEERFNLLESQYEKRIHLLEKEVDKLIDTIKTLESELNHLEIKSRNYINYTYSSDSGK